MHALTLVLLPGMDGTGRMFEPFVAALGSTYRTLCIRYPGDMAKGYAELETLVRSQLPQEEPYWVLGESFSGPIAAALAATPPPGLVGVILCCSFLRNPQPLLVGFRRWLSLVPFGRIPVRTMAPLLLGKYSTPALCAELALALAGVSSKVLRARLQAVLDVDVREFFAAAKLPVLYLQADKDWVVPQRAAAEVKACLPSAVVQVLAGPHLLLQANAAGAARAIGAFVHRIPPSAPS